MNVGDEMDEKLEGLEPSGSRFVLVGQDSPEYFDAINYAIMVVGFRLGMLFTAAIAIPRFGETGQPKVSGRWGHGRCQRRFGDLQVPRRATAC
jgi:hypothetical protein